jgi:hypothetical protein
MGYPSERPESSCAKSGRDSTTCCPKCHTFQVAGGGPGWQVAGSGGGWQEVNFQPLTANRYHLTWVTGDSHQGIGLSGVSCSAFGSQLRVPAADLGWSALPQ